MTVGQAMTRRRVLAGLGGASLAMALTRAGFAQDAGTPASTPMASGLGPIPTGGTDASGAWSFTDDRGVVVTADKRPTKVVAYIGIASALYDFGFEVTGFFSGESLENVDPKTIAPNLPFDRMTNLGFGDALDVEQILSIGTDLFIGANYDVSGSSGAIWPIPQDIVDQIAKVAGVVAIAYSDGTDAARLIQTNESLAAALGSDVDSAENAAAKTTFEETLRGFQTVVEAKPGFTALFMTGAADGFYIGKNLADLNLYAGAGLDIVGIEGYDIQSWETFAKVDADAIFVDNRATGWLQPDQMKEQIPTWSLHPAVEAGQVYPWQNEYVPSYTGFTPVLEGIVTAVTEATNLG